MQVSGDEQKGLGHATHHMAATVGRAVWGVTPPLSADLDRSGRREDSATARGGRWGPNASQPLLHDGSGSSRRTPTLADVVTQSQHKRTWEK